MISNKSSSRVIKRNFVSPERVGWNNHRAENITVKNFVSKKIAFKNESLRLLKIYKKLRQFVTVRLNYKKNKFAI